MKNQLHTLSIIEFLPPVQGSRDAPAKNVRLCQTLDLNQNNDTHYCPIQTLAPRSFFPLVSICCTYMPDQACTCFHFQPLRSDSESMRSHQTMEGWHPSKRAICSFLVNEAAPVLTHNLLARASQWNLKSAGCLRAKNSKLLYKSVCIRQLRLQTATRPAFTWNCFDSLALTEVVADWATGLHIQEALQRDRNLDVLVTMASRFDGACNEGSHMSAKHR